MPNKELEKRLGIKVSDERLKLNKRLPYIKLPKEKVNLFIDWYNQDLRTIKDIPRVFEEGYLEIDISDMVKTRTFSIFEVQNDEEYENVKKLNQALEIAYSKIIIHFKGNTLDDSVEIEGYCGTGDMLFRNSIDPKGNDLINKIKNYIVNDALMGKDKVQRDDIEEKQDYLPKVKRQLELNLKTREPKEYSKNQSEFNVALCNNCRALTLAVIWYLATNKAEKYIVDENTQIVEAKTHHKSKHRNHTRNIKTPIYDLVDNRTTTVERLIKKRNGWTISHSFQVRGHYRHYKNGKTIFIKSFEKGKGLDNFQSVNITISPEE